MLCVTYRTSNRTYTSQDFKELIMYNGYKCVHIRGPKLCISSDELHTAPTTRISAVANMC